MGNKRDIGEREADRAVLAALRARDGVATLADVVVAVALPQSAVERALERLTVRFESTLAVGEGGVLLYRFARGLGGRFRPRRAHRPVLRAVVRTATVVARETVRALRAAFRTLLALQLIVYTFLILTPISAVIGAVLGVGLAVVLVVGALLEGEASVFELLAEPWLAVLFVAGCMIYCIWRVLKKQRDVLLAVVGREPDGAGGLAGFIHQVNDFALGPQAPRAPEDAYADERRVLHRVREGGGVLRAGDLVAWLGLTYAEADRQAARLSAEYHGDAALVPPDEAAVPRRRGTRKRSAASPPRDAGDAAALAVLEFRLPILDTAGGRTPPAPEPRTAHERGVPLPMLTGNATREDAFIAAFALLNASVGLVVAHFVGRHVAAGTEFPKLWDVAYWAGGVLPVVFAAAIFAFWALRAPLHWIRLAIARRRRERAAILDAIVAHARKHGAAPVALEALARAPREAIRRVAAALEGTFDLERPGERTAWSFPRLAAELRAPRQGGPVRRVENVVFEDSR